MIVNHLFEMGDDEDGSDLTPSLGNTLHPAVYLETLEAAVAPFHAKRNQLTGGQLHIMIPMNSLNSPTGAGQLRYNTETWAAVNADNTQFLPNQPEVPGPNIAHDIQQQFETATGLTAILHPYEVSNSDNVPDPAAQAGHGEFVLQFDPANQPGTAQPNGVQLWIEGQPQLNVANPDNGWNF